MMSDENEFNVISLKSSYFHTVEHIEWGQVVRIVLCVAEWQMKAHNTQQHHDHLLKCDAFTVKIAK